MRKIILSVWFLLLASAGYAFSLGDVASQLKVGVSFVSEGLLFITLVTGSLMVFGSFFKYMKYRKNPIEIKFSSVVVMLVSGLALVALYFLPHLSK